MGVQLQKSLSERVEEKKMPKPLDKLSESELERKKSIGRVTTHVLRHLTMEFTGQGFEWLSPVIFSRSTDPLWPDPGASIEKRVEVEIYGETVRTTLSMIIHKLVACSLAYPKFFILSPNFRVEKRERKATGWHAYEFTQLDFEVRNVTSREIMSFVEKALYRLIEDSKAKVRGELIQLGSYHSLSVPITPFKVYDREELIARYGKDWETGLTSEISAPAWVKNIPREFYDFEDFEKGKWDNYDLFLPKYGEVLSGARREWEYTKIVKKMKRDGVKKENYQLLLGLAKEGRLKPSAGAGIGVERLIGWMVGTRHIGEVQPFPKIPGIVNDL